MFVKFLIVSTFIVLAGPIENEGGREAIEEKGFKPAVEQAVKDRQAVDYSKLND